MPFDQKPSGGGSFKKGPGTIDVKNIEWEVLFITPYFLLHSNVWQVKIYLIFMPCYEYSVKRSSADMKERIFSQSLLPSFPHLLLTHSISNEHWRSTEAIIVQFDPFKKVCNYYNCNWSLRPPSSLQSFCSRICLTLPAAPPSPPAGASVLSRAPITSATFVLKQQLCSLVPKIVAFSHLHG